MMLLVALVTIVPVSELALSFLNTILTTIIPPRPLPKLALKNGVPDEMRTIVAVPDDPLVAFTESKSSSTRSRSARSPITMRTCGSLCSAIGRTPRPRCAPATRSSSIWRPI